MKEEPLTEKPRRVVPSGAWVFYVRVWGCGGVLQFSSGVEQADVWDLIDRKDLQRVVADVNRWSLIDHNTNQPL